MRKAGFSYPGACVEDINYRSDRDLKPKLLLRLGTCNYIKEKHNIIIQGATGSGKTYIACAFGIAAVRQFYTVKYIRLPGLLCDFQTATALGIFRSVIDAYAKVNLLILDEWLLYPLADDTFCDLLELAERHYHIASTIFCSSFSTRGWYNKIPNPLLAEAICDRIVHDSYTITVKEKDSMCKVNGIQEKIS